MSLYSKSTGPVYNTNSSSPTSNHSNSNHNLPKKKMNTRLAPKKVSIALAVLSPACFLATAALQQLQVVENSVLPFLYNFFLRKDIPFVMTGVMFFWVYVLTASLSVVAQAAGLRNGYDNNEPRHYKPSVRGAFGRMIAAHQVALESVPAFFAVVIIASAKQVPLEYRIDFSILYTFLRIIHTPLYILNFDIARAITHMMATSCVAWLFAFALIPGFERNYYSFIMDVVRLQRGVSSGGFWGID